jgi:hypothetical protein
MPKIKLLPIAKSIAIALIFFALGRILVLQLGNIGIVIVLVVVIVFYGIWWVKYQKNKQNS